MDDGWNKIWWGVCVVGIALIFEKDIGAFRWLGIPVALLGLWRAFAPYLGGPTGKRDSDKG